MCHTQYNNYNWGDDIKNYAYTHTHLGWSGNATQPVVTSKQVKKNDIIYNPILQTYSNTQYEFDLRKKEKSDLIKTIIKNQDNQLKNEQTFNIINLTDRLKGFENDPNYPKMKDLIHSRKVIETNPKNFNIISNLPLSEHHFDRPEKRPVYQQTEPKRHITYKIGQDRDFDIISTRYKHYNDEKIEVDKQIQKIQTAQIFYKKNDYNPIKGEYFNKSKEKEFLQKRAEEQKNWGKDFIEKMPKCAKGKSDIYNLITLKVVDQKEMDNIIQTEKNKKQRYEIRYKIEGYYRDKCMKNLDRLEINKNRKASFYRYKEQDERQYDIIDLKDKPFKEHQNVIKVGGVSDWEILLKGAGKNNTFCTKKIYKDLYDYSEAGLSYDKYRKNRKNKMEVLPSIDKDKLFNQRIKKQSKCILDKKNSASVREYDIKRGEFDKQKFFKQPPKTVKYENFGKGRNLSFYAQSSRLNKLFEDNREKNMRNLRKNLDFETTVNSNTVNVNK